MLPDEKHLSKAAREVALIAKNREERRQKQADEKALKDATALAQQGSPHWEIASMIKVLQQRF